MALLLGTVFIASIVGSLHCIGMCGPFALMAGSGHSNKQKAWKATAAYSLGRLTTYSIVGVLFGAIGMALNRGTSFAPWQQTSTYVAGAVMIAIGLIALARHFGWRVDLPTIAPRLSRILQQLFRPVTRQPPLRKAFMIGGLTCLMPCGWLYSFAIVSAGTGSPMWGGLVMIFFWMGTVPVMTALMMGFSKIGAGLQQQLPLAMASLVVMVGVFTIVYRAPIVISGPNDINVSEIQELVEHVNSVDHQSLPCCAK